VASEIEESSGQKKLAITDKEFIFLDKWVELQKMVETKNTRTLRGPSPWDSNDNG
jgi:hypothetical protein